MEKVEISTDSTNIIIPLYNILHTVFCIIKLNFKTTTTTIHDKKEGNENQNTFIAHSMYHKI
jgi:hypothetical protein